MGLLLKSHLRPVTKAEPFFATCERDDLGHCKPRGSAGTPAGGDGGSALQTEAEEEKPRGTFMGETLGSPFKQDMDDVNAVAYQCMGTANDYLERVRYDPDKSEGIAVANKYTNTLYEELNESMKKCPPDFKCLDEHLKKHLDKLLPLLDDAPEFDEPIRTFRGAAISYDRYNELIEKCLECKEKGIPFTYPKIVSTSIKADTSLSFSSVRASNFSNTFKNRVPVMFQFEAKKGLYVEPITASNGEHEVLQSPHTEYDVVGVADVEYKISGYKSYKVSTIYLREREWWKNKKTGETKSLRRGRNSLTMTKTSVPYSSNSVVGSVTSLTSSLNPRNNHSRAMTLAVDFDGRIADWREDYDLAKTEPRRGCRESLERLREAGILIIVWTARGDPEDVKSWLEQYEIPYDAYNENPWFHKDGMSRKIVADMYLDDNGEGDPEAEWDELFELVVARLFGKSRQPIDKHDGWEELLAIAEPGHTELMGILSDVTGFDVYAFDPTSAPLGEFEERLRRPGGLVVMPPLKSEKRAREKVEGDYDGDYRKLLDIVRAAVAVEQLPDVYLESKKVLASEKVRLARLPKDRFKSPLANGYRDLLCNYKLPSGLIVEVQYHVKPILIAREREKVAYDVVRAIKASMEEEGRDEMTPAEAEACRRARKASKHIYARAWSEVQASSTNAMPEEKSLKAQRGQEGETLLDVATDISREDYALRSALLPPVLPQEQFTKGSGATCKPGERADLTGCIPALSKPGGNQSSNKRPVSSLEGGRESRKPEGGPHQLSGLFSRISKPDGGFTYQPVSRHQPKAGFAVSPYPQRSFAVDVKTLKPVDIARYMLKNKDLLEQTDHYLGAWHDPASGKVFLDVSVVKKDPKEAERLSMEHDQIAYFDLAKGVSVTVNPDATSGGVKSYGRTKAARGQAVLRSHILGRNGSRGARPVPKSYGEGADRGGDTGDGATTLGGPGRTVIKERGMPCKQGETAALTGCIPAVREGGTGNRPSPVQEAPKAKPKPLPPLKEVPPIRPPSSPKEIGRWLHEVGKHPYIAEAGRLLKELGGEASSTDRKYKHPDGSWDQKRVQEVHQPVFDEFLNPKAKAPDGARPKFVMVIGPPGAGKTTVGRPYVNELVPEHTLVDPDDIRGMIPEYNGWNAPQVHKEAVYLSEEVQRRAVEQRHNILYDGTGRWSEWTNNLADEMTKAGYDVHVVLVTAPVKDAVHRTVQRFLANPFGAADPSAKPSRYVNPKFVVRHVDGHPSKTYELLRKNPNVKSGKKLTTKHGQQGVEVLDEFTR